MAEGKVDLPEDLVLSKPAEVGWAAKDDASGGNDEEKVFMGFLDESKDVTSENSIPLSPQWLYAKVSESKASLSTASADIRPPNSLSYGTSSDSINKDVWRLDGSHDKREWRRNAPDIEISRRWREEERETGLLGRRERRKEGERENEYRKSDRRSDNVSVRDTTDSRILSSSDRWHEVSGRNSGHESRRDSKWSSRWGPEDKEKDSRNEKKMDIEKDDTHIEKQSFAGSHRSAASESDSRDKWRPRHRQEIHSGGSTVYRAAPGFGLERGRVEGSNVGFAPGRGRSNYVGSLPFGRSFSAAPIGAAPVNKSELLHGKSSSSVDTFCYPRGKLLDIYRKHKVLPSFDTTPEGLEEAPPITQLSSITPFSLVVPDAEEEALLEDIWKGKVTSSESYHNSNRDTVERISNDETDVGDVAVIKKHGIISTSCSEENSFINYGGYDASHENLFDPLNDRDPCLGEFKGKVNSLVDVAVSSGLAPKFSTDDVCYNIGLPGGNHTDSEQKAGETKVVNGDDYAEHFAFLKNPKFEGIESAVSFDVCARLNESTSMFNTPFFQEISSTGEQYQNSNGRAKLLEQVTPPEEMSLLYRDPQGEIQGPFLGVDIISWFDQGFFDIDLPVCLSDAREAASFQPLGEVMPHLKLRAYSIPVVNPGDLSEPSDTIRDLEASTLAANFTGSVAIKNQRSSSEFEGPLDHQIQPRIPEHEGLVDPHYGRLPLSKEISADVLSVERKSTHEFVGQDFEEVLYSGRPVNSIENPLEKPANNLHDLSRTPSGHHFLASEIGEVNMTNHKVPTDNDLHPLGLLWSELEGAQAKRPLSSNIPSIRDQGRLVYPAVGGDTSLFSHKQESFSSLVDPPDFRDAWSNKSRRNMSSNTRVDAMDAHHFSRLEPEINQSTLEKHLLSQQLQKQQLQQQHILSPRHNLHLTGSFLDQVQGSVHHQQSVNQSVPDLEHVLKLQLQQQRHFQQLQQQQQQQQLHRRQMQLLQEQQHQQQQQQQQLLLEQLLHQKFNDPGFGMSRDDPLRGHNMLDQILFRQHLLHELQQQSHHLPRQHDPSLEQLIQAKFGHNLHRERHNDLLDVLSHPKQRQMLPPEQQLLLGFQQEQLLSQQIPMASRQQPGMEEERHVGGVWSVDESGQFIRAAAVPHQTQPIGLNQLDFMQPQQRPLSFEQLNHLDRNFALHEQMQRGVYDPNPQPFERSISLPSGTPASNVEFVNALARFQGMDVQEHHGQMHSSGQVAQFPSGVRSHQHHIPNQFTASQLDATGTRWSESDGQLTNNLIESQFNQLHLEAEQQKRDLSVNLSIEDPNSWASLAGNDVNSKSRLVDLLHHKLSLHSPESSGMMDGAPISSYEMREPSWLISGSASDHPFNCLGDSSLESSQVPKARQPSQDRLMNVDTNSIRSSGSLAFLSSSGASIEDKQLFADMIEIEKEFYADSMGGNPSMNKIDFSDAKEEKRGKKRGSKGKAMNRSVLDTQESEAEQAGGSIINQGELKVNTPIGLASFGSAGGNACFYNYGVGMDNAYSEEMACDRMSGILPKGADNSSSNSPHGPHIFPSQGALSPLASALPIKGKHSTSFASSEEERGELGGNLAVLASETPGSKKDVRFRHTSSCTDADAPETSFIDMLRSAKKPVPEADASTGALEFSDTGPGGRNSKKKGKKGRQIDPSLLGFKVHSNRILMGEIQRPDE